MLWEDSRDRYTFVHDKLREALLGLMRGEELRDLHRLAARTIANSPQADPFELAYHFDAAGEYPQALPYALVAPTTDAGTSAFGWLKFFPSRPPCPVQRR